MTLNFQQAIITGAKGFLGHNLAIHLENQGVQVIAIDKKEDTNHAHSKQLFYNLDLSKRDCLKDIPEITKQSTASETVTFHLAGLSHKTSCSDNPLDAINTNIATCINVVDSCRKHGINRVLFPSTSLVYGAMTSEPVKETSPVYPSSIYVASKLSAEYLLQSYAKEFGFSCDIVRLANVYGYGAIHDSVTALLIEQALHKKVLSIKTLKPLRDFIYIKDVVEGMSSIASTNKGIGARIYNLGTGQGYSIRELASLIKQIFKSPHEVCETAPNNLDSANQLVLNIDKIKDEIGWVPKWSLKRGIEDTLKEMQNKGL